MVIKGKKKQKTTNETDISTNPNSRIIPLVLIQVSIVSLILSTKRRIQKKANDAVYMQYNHSKIFSSTDTAARATNYKATVKISKRKK